MTIGWVVAAVCLIIVGMLVRSPWGRVLRAIREDEDAARSLGKNVFAYKLQSLVSAGSIGALAGMVLAIDRQDVQPDTFLPVVTFVVYTIVILGGPGTRARPARRCGDLLVLDPVHRRLPPRRNRVRLDPDLGDLGRPTSARCGSCSSASH